MKIPLNVAETTKTYQSKGRISITRTLTPIALEDALEPVLEGINHYKGALFTSGYEYPGRYSRWDIGFLNPPVELRSFGRDFEIRALNERGRLLLDMINSCLTAGQGFSFEKEPGRIAGRIEACSDAFTEEERTLQPSVFRLMRGIKEIFTNEEDSNLGLYGAFGYDLVFQFESMALTHRRSPEVPDLVLYLPDELVVVDRQLGFAYRAEYDFAYNGMNTEGLTRQTEAISGQRQHRETPPAYEQGRYAKLVMEAIKAFKAGNLFEVVPSHTLYEPCETPPAEIFKRLTALNPSPYGFIIHLGDEHLIGASPEMYVRVNGKRVETCPISGTIRRGSSPIEDAEQIRALLNSAKDEAELTMCTDVDRNDKSRVCIPGTVKVIGRRQLEMYSHLIHTVDHIEGILAEDYDALDAFMSHMWAVTVTGAPKRAAISWIESHEDRPRHWYGGAVGFYTFDGNLNTGLTLRTIRLSAEVAEIRVGATLLYDSDPMEEEMETLTKGAAMVQSIRNTEASPKDRETAVSQVGRGKQILFIDHEDSFVHTLANYFRQTGAQVTTMRSEQARQVLRLGNPFDGVVLSPGPGRPDQFGLKETIRLCLERNLPVFGVCLGLQGIVEYFGGSLDMLDYPQHGKPAIVTTVGDSLLLRGLGDQFRVGRYHSIYAAFLPECLKPTAYSQDGIVMAVEHKELPIAAVQFHPESILTSAGHIGQRLIENYLERFEVVKK
ncbi:anthranilate synthase component I [Paenibacillus sp. FSL M7-1455]|uniref:anthranilate synthase component I n=1 Tax=Paenibacillus sp. FSL M7-1455 TaxID=2975316 RepID=UPI0030FB4A21